MEHCTDTCERTSTQKSNVRHKPLKLTRHVVVQKSVKTSIVMTFKSFLLDWANVHQWKRLAHVGNVKAAFTNLAGSIWQLLISPNPQFRRPHCLSWRTCIHCPGLLRQRGKKEKANTIRFTCSQNCRQQQQADVQALHRRVNKRAVPLLHKPLCGGILSCSENHSHQLKQRLAECLAKTKRNRRKEEKVKYSIAHTYKHIKRKLFKRDYTKMNTTRWVTQNSRITCWGIVPPAALTVLSANDNTTQMTENKWGGQRDRWKGLGGWLASDAPVMERHHTQAFPLAGTVTLPGPTDHIHGLIRSSAMPLSSVGTCKPAKILQHVLLYPSAPSPCLVPRA